MDAASVSPAIARMAVCGLIGGMAARQKTGRNKMIRVEVMRTRQRYALRAAALAAAVACGGGTAAAQTTATASQGNAFHEPPVFSSEAGALNILMNVKAKPIPTIAFTSPTTGRTIHPVGWGYEICQPDGTGCVWDYGGVRLALKQGDTLKSHFTNQLPPFDPNKLLHAPDDPNDVLNPVNLHTHGLLTQARAPTVANPTWGDDIFVQVFNPANGMPNPANSPHNMGDVVVGPIDYSIPVAPNMPSSLLWYHAHVHGIALEQVSHGMAGFLTIGAMGDNVTGDANNLPFPDANVRHLMLKEVAVLAAGTVDFGGGAGEQPVADGELLAHTDSGFCNQFPLPGDPPRRGSCPGVDATANGDDNFTGGVWYFTVNGIQYPTIPITAPDGEIWRIGTAAGSLTWDLQLVNDQTQKPMTVQLIAIDGIAVHLPQDTPTSATVSMAGGKFHVVPCPNAQVITAVPVCVDEMVMMPSSRVEVWVTYRNQQGVITPPLAGTTATFKMIGATMGSGDGWPAIDLAKVQFNQTGGRKFTANQLVVKDSGLTTQPGGIFVAANATAQAAPLPAGCKPLPAGHRRRIFFGFSNTLINNTFALGYEEIDQNGNVVPGSHLPAVDPDPLNSPNDGNGLTPFDSNVTTICLPLAPGQKPVTETWELVQLSTENHNFHLHQSRFLEKVGPDAGTVIQDNFPLGVAVPDAAISDQVLNPDNPNFQNNVCRIGQWRSGDCVSAAVVEQIAFAFTGEFVYHCHILEHEDGGMMARIVVVPSPG
jgi:L-ascorbate oxidase